MPDKVAVIIGAGPAGITAAHELVSRTQVKPVLIEKDDCIGGLARTVNYKGNRIDIGPHRFFSKSDRVMDWWMKMIPLAASNDGPTEISYQNKSRTIEGKGPGVDADKEDRVMITISRLTRIYFLRKFFDYPISLKVQTILNLGIPRMMRIGFSYLRAMAFPIKPETNLEQFLINRFGRELYLTFFKDYTEKVWGTPCDQISAAWGAQRIKGLNIMKALAHAAKQMVPKGSDIRQKDTETSLVEQFLFPKLGAGQMWDIAADQVREQGGEFHHNLNVERINVDGNLVKSIEVRNSQTGEKETFEGDYFFSSMPIKELMDAISETVPPSVKEVSDGLVYRDFVEVGLLVNKLKVSDDTPTGKQLIKDNWIYIQESDVLVGRMQIWNNWGPGMVADPTKVWIGCEYFCYCTDPIWTMTDAQIIELAGFELDKIGIIDKNEVIDAMVIRMPKTYPGYFGTYDRFEEIQKYINKFENLFLVGRNGMHKYNNQDHSMLTAMVSVDNIVEGIKTKDNIWDVNTEMEYHEEKS